MSRGRPANIPRNEARAAGHRTYVDPTPCFACGSVERYASNAQCVECLIAKGKERYAALDAAGLEQWKGRDRERYLKRLARK